MRGQLPSISLSLAVLVSPAATWAADAPPVDDIVVTADVQAKVVDAGLLGTIDILTTPYSVNSIPSDTIELRQTRTLIELQKTEPSAQFLFNGFGAPVVAIRGFAADVRLDGARSQYSAQFPLEFVDRIDIVKGAASFLYGFVAPGGTVDYVLKRPGPDAFVAVAGSYRSDANLLGRVDVNVPVTDRFGVRVNALYEGGDTYLDDDRQDRLAASFAAEWRPTDTLRLQGDFTYQRNQPKSGGNATFFFVPGVEIPRAPNPRTRYLQDWERLRVNVSSYGLRGDWDFAPDWTLTARARGFIQHRSYYSSGGLSYLPGGAITNDIFVFNDGQNSFQQQAIVSGKVALGSTTHNLTFAADRQYDPLYSGTSFNFFSFDSGTIDAPLDLPRPADRRLPSDPRYRNGRTIQVAGTVADRIEFGPWTALVALRYVDFSQKNFDPDGALSARDDATAWTPTIGLLRRFGDVSVYGSYAQSLEQGQTPPVSSTNPSPTPLGPVRSDQFEIGAKAQLFGGLTATAAVFHLRRDYQGATVLDDGVTPGFIEAGKQVHTGAELTLSGKVAPGWNVIGGATWLDAKIKDASGFAIDGDTPAGIAKFQATLFVEHEVTRGLFLNGSVFHASGREIDSPTDRRIPGYTTFDGGVRLVREIAGQTVSLNANVENIFDKRYYGGVYFGIVSLGTPRQAKVTLSTVF